MKLDMEPIRTGSRFWQQIHTLAKEAFPPEEYLPPEKLVDMAQSPDFDYLALTDGDAFVGFLAVQLYGALSYLFFLAIDPAQRSKGYGSQALEVLKDRYPDKQQVVDFEMVDPTAANYSQRLKRKAFYLRSGYRETGLFLSYFGVDYEVMCRGTDFSEEAFRELMLHLPVEGFDPKFYHK